MVKNIIKKSNTKELIFIGIVIVSFFVVAGKYLYPTIRNYYEDWSERRVSASQDRERYAYVCPPGTTAIMLSVDGAKVCRGEEEPSAYRDIFDTYSFKSSGKEQSYSFLSIGSMENANKLLRNIVPFDRYDDFAIGEQIQWNEDPYDNDYWRFMFYGLRQFPDLFYAFDQTANTAYLQKVKETTLSFINVGTDTEIAWEDYHSTSFRTMILIKTWWQLRANNMLDYDTSEKLLTSIEMHANFLADPNHYEKWYNHGLNEAVALYLVAVNFPDLPSAQNWLDISKQRLSQGLVSVVDKDGVLIENSPYYHFYTLEKYWEINGYSKKFDVPISNTFDDRLSKMVAYATYILQPNNEIPLLGASISRKIADNGIYQQISEQFPDFKYVLAQGTKGVKPEKKVVTFPTSGEVIMRSGWSKRNYTDHTQVIFDAGPFRTDHSDYDALSFTLYSKGRELMPDSGLYTYELNAYKEYFHGTYAHNTVTVDGKDQQKGSGVLGQLVDREGLIAQSATHDLYKGVTHKRTISLIDDNYVVIIDKLSSEKDHVYDQVFHLFPGAHIVTDGATVHVYETEDTTQEPVMSLYQIASDPVSLQTYIAQDTPFKGYCSVEYEKMIPCYALEYRQYAKNAQYVTLIEIGAHDKNLAYSVVDNTISIHTTKKDIQFAITETVEVKAGISASPHTLPVVTGTSLAHMDPTTWTVEDGTLTKDSGNLVLTATNTETVTAYQPLHTDLSNSNLLIKAKVADRNQLTRFDVLLYSNEGRASVVNSLKQSFRKEDNNEWVTISLGKSFNRSIGSYWKAEGEGFDWSHVDGVKISMRSNIPNSSLPINRLSTTPGRAEGEIVIVFDDGYTSNLAAVEVMNTYGIKGNIAVIAERIEDNELGYLSLTQLQTIQNMYGWNIVNHSHYHLSAIESYLNTGTLNEFESDILYGARFLAENDLNKAPNWYIYPRGRTSKAIKDIVQKYYTFARSALNQIESYPFGDPFEVKIISADDYDFSAVNKTIPVEELMKAVDDATKYKTPLFITFHRIKASETDKPGYPIREFEKLIQYIKEKGIHVKTLAQFDTDNKLEQKPIIFTPGTLSQIEITGSIAEISIVQRLTAYLKNI